MKFKKKYTEYWEEATIKPIDGLAIAGLREVHTFLPYLKIKKGEKLLDMGCSYGRMYDALANYTENISGVEPDPYAVEKAKLRGYEEVLVGTAEQTGFEPNYFDHVFSWAVFDVVDHAKGFAEASRILKTGGNFLVTGKNINYYEDDNFAFKAEKNAFLKAFPNHFADLKALISCLPALGFKLVRLFLFPKRGDFGQLKFVEVDFSMDEYNGYEYMIICQKVGSSKSGVSEKLDYPFSLTAQRIAANRNYASPQELFTALGID
mgnify:CR=1 FL=1